MLARWRAERKTILVSSSGRDVVAVAEGHYQLNDAQARPYTFNIQPFVADNNVAQQAYVSSEVFRCKGGVKANFFLFSEHGYPLRRHYDCPPETIADRKAAMAKFVRASMEGWVSYLNNPAPGNALIKQDNPKMTDDLLAWAVTQIRQHHLIDGGDAATEGWGTMTETRWRKTRDFMVSANLLDAATDWKQAYTTEFVQAMQVKP